MTFTFLLNQCYNLDTKIIIAVYILHFSLLVSSSFPLDFWKPDD